jgi:5-formyltetrahydrofolate cyclo-ligase
MSVEPVPGQSTKGAIRRHLRDTLAVMTEADRHAKSIAACTAITSSAEFSLARVIMIYLTLPNELDTTSIALRAWQDNKNVVVPKVAWDQRRMLPVEITSLNSDNLTTTGPGVREPIAGTPIPVGDIDLVIVPGLGFTRDGHRIGRGMGFYDRFLAQTDFLGLSCGLAFEEQIIDQIPVLDHDIPLSMLVTDQAVRRFASSCICDRS